MTQAAAMEPVRLQSSGFARIVTFAMIGLAAISVAIVMGGRLFGHSISMGGHTDSTAPYEIVIGNNVVLARANLIRFDHARRNGVAERLDLYMRWPDMSGYSNEHSADFNNLAATPNLIFASFEPRIMSRDMSGRFDPIYSSLIVKPGKHTASGLTTYAFTVKSGYQNERLVVAERNGHEPFVARCLTGPAAETSLAPCQRDVAIGENLSLSYRFPARLLTEWKALDAAVLDKANSMLRVGR